MKTLVAMFVLFLAISSRGAFVPGVTTTNLPIVQSTLVYTNVFVTVSAISGVASNNGANFGPDTPGTTTCGIQEALNSLTNITTVLGGGTLSFGKGIFSCSSQIVVPVGGSFNIVLEGVGQTATAIVYTNTTVQDFIICSTITDNGEVSRNLSLVIRNLGVYYLNDTNKAIICHFSQVHDALLDNCRFGSYNGLFTNGVASPNNVDGYPTNKIGIIGVKFNNETLNNLVLVKACFFAHLANGLSVGGDHNIIKDCFFTGIGFSNAWSVILTNKQDGARPYGPVTQNNQYAAGSGIIADNGLLQTIVENCEWYKCKVGILSDFFPGSAGVSVLGYSEFEQCSNRIMKVYFPVNAGTGIQGSDIVDPNIIRTVETPHDMAGYDWFYSLTNGAFSALPLSVTTTHNRELFLVNEPTYGMAMMLTTNGLVGGTPLDYGPIPLFVVGQSGDFATCGGIDVGIDPINNFGIGGFGTIYLNPSGELYAAGGAFTVSSSGNVSAPNINVVAIQTNWISGALYTNTSAQDWLVRSSAKLTTAAVTGDASMRLQTGAQGGSLATISACEMQTTVAVTISMVYTNEVAGIIASGNVFAFTNFSSGAGNTATLLAGTGQKKQF